MNGTRRRLRRRSWHGNLLAVLGALLAGAAFLTVQQLASDLHAANQARDALATQVQRLGGTPVAGPPGSRGEPGKNGIDGAGAAGPKGDAGEPGSPGEPGPSGSPGKNGKNGKNGRDGTDGENGSDGTGQTGTDGAAGPAGPPGVQGDPGPAGKDGQDGKDGADGQSCPTGYSLQQPSYDPDALVCRRDQAPGDNDPTPESSPPSLGLDPTRRQYT